MSLAGSGPDCVVDDASMKRSLSASLYWYVEKSLEDLLEEYMLLVKNDNVNTNDEIMATEINSIISRMLELPIEFDSTSCQLSASLILSCVYRNIESTKACGYLLTAIFKTKSTTTVILKSDFLTLLEQILTREVKGEEYFKPTSPVIEQLSSSKKAHEQKRTDKFEIENEEELHPKVEGHAYADILVELYREEFVSATQVLVYLQELSKRTFSYYRTDLLLYLLCRIGISIENKLSKRSRRDILDFSLPPSCLNFSGSSETGTFDGIYKRLDSLMSHVHTTELLELYDKVMKQKQSKTSKIKTKKTRSNDSLKNVCLYRGHMRELRDQHTQLTIHNTLEHNNLISLSDTALAISKAENDGDEEEGKTAF